MFLIVTNKRDLTSDFIILEMQRRQLPYFRLNTEDVTEAKFECAPSLGDHWRFTIGDQTFDTSRVRAAYFRRPGRPMALAVLSDDLQTFCASEWHASLQSLYWSLGECWLNAPHCIALAEDKIRQLVTARQLGFRLPDTLLTNDPMSASAFGRKGPLIGKPLRNALLREGSSERVIFTTRIDTSSLVRPLEISSCPVIFQREITKRYDIRATVVGNRVFTAAIHSQDDDATRVDWRHTSSPNLLHTVHSLPKELEEKCIALTRRLGLRFGAIDFVLDLKGNYWFLEINPNGQWGWIETRTGLPIAAAIVSELERIGE